MLLRAAKKEEIEKIAPQADLDPTCLVIALDSPKGTILAVLRVATEVDPAFFPEGCDTRQKLLFMRDIENFLIGRGVAQYYFNLHADEASVDYRSAVEKWGAQPVSTAPDIRFKKQLFQPV